MRHQRPDPPKNADPTGPVAGSLGWRIGGRVAPCSLAADSAVERRPVEAKAGSASDDCEGVVHAVPANLQRLDPDRRSSNRLDPEGDVHTRPGVGQGDLPVANPTAAPPPSRTKRTVPLANAERLVRRCTTAR